jgi:tetratricopeptide repeat protein
LYDNFAKFLVSSLSVLAEFNSALSYLRWLFAIVVVLLATIAPARVSADTPDRAALLAKQDALFQQMLDNPSNLDVTFAYADVSAELGDNEAAVSALERMLLFNPNLPRVDLELGVLYFRMGSFKAAESYFNKAKSFNPPADVTARVDEYLSKIHAADKTSQFSGYIFTGVQYQTDANVAPGSPLIHSPIGDVLLSNQFVKGHDVDLFGSGSFLYSYDLGTQSGDTLEVGGTGYGNHYFRFNRLDLDLGEITAGPRLRYRDLSIPFVQSATFKPYVIVNEVGLGEEQYFWTYGAGLEATAMLWSDLAAKLIYEARVKNFSNAATRPLSRGLNGVDNLVSLDLSKPIAVNQTVSAQLDYLDQDTRLGFYANKTYSISGGYQIRYQSPFDWFNFPMETVAFGSRSWSDYHQPDPCCNTSGSAFIFSPSSRFDRHWRFGITQTINITDNIALILQLQRDIVSSNLSIYAYTSNAVLFGPQIRF